MATGTSRSSNYLSLLTARCSRRLAVAALCALATSCAMVDTVVVVDHPPQPGDPARAGEPLPGLNAEQLALFALARAEFLEHDTVDGHDDTTKGLGPRFNLDGCAGCHAFPALGGSSPPVNREVAIAHAEGASNAASIPFVRTDGPTVEVRFKWQLDASGRFVNGSVQTGGKSGRIADGGVHALFTIAGRTDADPGCRIEQPPFQKAWELDNVTLRIPTPVFGLGLIEAIDEVTINHNAARTVMAMANAQKTGTLKAADYGVEPDDMGNVQAHAAMNKMLGIHGRPGRGRENLSGNDSTITRFGWKAQNKSLLLFSGEAYNVEQGVTNDLFPNERDQEPVALSPACKTNPTPEDTIRIAFADGAATGSAERQLDVAPGDIDLFTAFMRLLAPPKSSCDLARDCAANVVRGSAVFDQIYCSACHVRQLEIGKSPIEAISRQKYAVLYSDLLLHKMGSCAPRADHSNACLADGIQQGQALGDEFRTAPLWGVGQRLFLLHDGRTSNLNEAILAHRGAGSEANAVIKRYFALAGASRQDLVDFLRTL